MFKKFAFTKKYITITCAFILALTSISASAGSLQDAKNEKNKLELRKQEIEATLAGLESKKNDIESFVREVDAKQKEIEEKMMKSHENDKNQNQILGEKVHRFSPFFKSYLLLKLIL